jgi:hypothetical protein
MELTKRKTMKDQEILANAPEGECSDVVDITGAYFDEHCNHLNSEGFWSELDIAPVSPRSLADIKRITELEKDKEFLLTQRLFGNVIVSTSQVLNAAIEAFKLEQQAKGVRDFFTRHRPRISMGKSAIWEVDDVLVDGCIERLTNESKALKEQANALKGQDDENGTTTL